MEVVPVECNRSDGSNFTYLTVEFDIVMAPEAHDEKEN